MPTGHIVILFAAPLAPPPNPARLRCAATVLRWHVRRQLLRGRLDAVSTDTLRRGIPLLKEAMVGRIGTMLGSPDNRLHIVSECGLRVPVRLANMQ